MNRFFTFLLLVVSVVAANAASPTLENFDQTHFRTNNPPPGIIRTRLSSSNFNQSGDTWTITNVSGATGASLWTNHVDEFLRVIPGNGNNGVEITNLWTRGILLDQGGLVLYGVLSSNLVTGLNELNPHEKNTLQLTGATPTPTDSNISLTSAGGPGSLLIVENYTEGFGFCLTNGTPQWDDPSASIILPNGDWCPTAEGEQIWLRLNGHGDWVEVLRVITSGPGFAIINPTDGFLPYRVNANSFGDSPIERLSSTSIQIADRFDFDIVGVGTTPRLRFYPSGGALAALTSSNGFNINIDGATPYQWRFNALNLEPQQAGSVLASASFPLNGIYTIQTIWGDGGAAIGWVNAVADSAGNGSPEGVLAAGLGSVYRNTNITGTLWLKESGGFGNTGWIQLGGGGATINPTDGRVPYRTGSTAFGDSPWFYHATNIMSFGSGTNQFLYQQDSDTFALGWKAAGDRILGNNNVAIGMQAMESADGQFQSVALGNFALKNNGGSDNTAIGHKALEAVNATALTSFGANNTAVGFVAMNNITNGYNNVAVGAEALQDVGDGRENTGLGYHAGDLFSGVNSVFAGALAGAYSSQTILTNVGAIGYNINPTNNNDFLIGNSTNNVKIPGTLTVAGGITGSAANWSPSGTTNSLLVGNAFANGATFTNGITAGASTFTGNVSGGASSGFQTAQNKAFEVYDGVSGGSGNRTGFFWHQSGVGAKLNLSSGGLIGWSASSTDAGTLDTILTRDAANTLALRNGANAQAFLVYNTYTDASNYERATILWSGNDCLIGTSNSGTGTSRDVRLRTGGAGSVFLDTGGTKRWQVNGSGHLLAVTDNTYDIGASGATRPRNVYTAGFVRAGTWLELATTSLIQPNGSGIIGLYNAAANNFDRLQFGGTSASFPALKRSTTNLVVRLADDSANTGLEANVLISRLNATSAAAPTIASATTIAPTNSVVFISGTDAIETITAPAPISATGGQITLIPTGIFTTTTAGNIALASTAVVSKAMIMTYDSGTTKWYPSY